jgi:hypothetical protein
MPVDQLITFSDLPHQCTYCKRTFETLHQARIIHPECAMWSCSFLPGLQHTIYPAGTRQDLETLCCFCNDILTHGAEGRVKGTILKEHMILHNFRNCNQRLYFSGQRFRQHLQDAHETTFNNTLFAGWTLLLKSCRKVQPSVFHPAGRAPTAVLRSSIEWGAVGSKRQEDDKAALIPDNFMELTDKQQRYEPNRLRRKSSAQAVAEDAAKRNRKSTLVFPLPVARHRAASTSSKSTATSLPVDGIDTCPVFYRKRLDSSTRNRIYIRQHDESLSASTQELFKKIPGSVLGGLLLHSSLAAAVPVRMTNSVDIYALH